MKDFIKGLVGTYESADDGTKDDIHLVVGIIAAIIGVAMTVFLLVLFFEYFLWIVFAGGAYLLASHFGYVPSPFKRKK